MIICNFSVDTLRNSKKFTQHVDTIISHKEKYLTKKNHTIPG